MTQAVEYLIVYSEKVPFMMQTELNEYGTEGWILCNVQALSNSHRVIFYRPIQAVKHSDIDAIVKAHNES